VNKLEERVEQQDGVIRDLEKRIDELEEGSPKAPPPVAAPPAPKRDEDAPRAAEEIEAQMFPQGRQSPVNRGTFDDHQRRPRALRLRARREVPRLHPGSAHGVHGRSTEAAPRSDGDAATPVMPVLLARRCSRSRT
jgi:hypothetical protein